MSSIAIIGAGPAGLTAARILQQRGVPATVFDADAGPHVRDQGGTLDLHVDGGRLAIELAGLGDAFRAKARFEDQTNRVVDHATAEILVESTPPDLEARPEIDRRELRDLLIASLAPEAIRWGKKLVRVDQHQDLVFADGTTERFDLVIGADGAWSKVRAALTSVVPSYTGITFYECWLDAIDERQPDLAAALGHGSIFSIHAQRGIVAQRNGHGHVRVYAVLHVPDRTPQSKTELLAHFTGWSPTLRGFIERTADRPIARPIHALPPDFAWPHSERLTLIGDAAHLMPPIGVGVNLAMQDAMDLALAYPAAVRGHEQAMIARANALAVEAAAGFQEMFSADGEAEVRDHLARRDRSRP